jgi:hypothetical protein
MTDDETIRMHEIEKLKIKRTEPGKVTAAADDPVLILMNNAEPYPPDLTEALENIQAVVAKQGKTFTDTDHAQVVKLYNMVESVWGEDDK